MKHMKITPLTNCNAKLTDAFRMEWTDNGKEEWQILVSRKLLVEMKMRIEYALTQTSKQED